MPLLSTLSNFKKELYHRVSRPNRIFFDHIPKCGGSSVNWYLSKNYPARLIFKVNGLNPTRSVENFKKLPKRVRYGYQLVMGHEAHKILGFVHPDSIFATLFRGPVDRIVSHYFFVLSRKRHYLHEEVTSKNILLKDYCSSGLSHELRNYYVTHYTGLSIADAEKNPKESVDLAFKIITEKYNLIGFQDEIPAFVNELYQLAKLPVPFDNVHRKKSKNRMTVDNLPKRTKEKIAEVNFLDVELYKRLLQLRDNGLIKNLGQNTQPIASTRSLSIEIS